MIKNEAMDVLIASLPIQEEGEIYIFSRDDPDGNVCTKAQVNAAKAKGWRVMYGHIGSWWYGQDYEGVNPAGITSVTTSEARKNVYSIDGKSLLKPQKGINIIDGKKIVVK